MCQLTGGEITAPGRRDHGAIVAVTVDVFGNRLHQLCDSRLHFQLGTLFHRAEIRAFCRLILALGKCGRDLGLRLCPRLALDDVIAVLRLNNAGHVTRLQREHALLKCRHHRALGKHTQVAALCGRSILAVFLGHRFEVRDRDLLQDALRFALRRITLCRLVRFRVRHKQDVASGQQLAIVVSLFIRAGIGRRKRLGHRLHELRGFDLSDLRPHRGISKLRIAEGVTLGAGLPKQLVIDPEIGNRHRNVLARLDP